MHLVLSLLLLLSAEPAQSKLPIELREGLAIRGVTRGGRVPFPLDAVQYAIVAGTFAKPEGGAEIEFGEAKRSWERLVAEEDGSIRGSAFSGGYAYFEVERPQREVAILEATGHGMAYVNGEPLAGDPYGYGYSKLPVDLKEGPNALLFASGRGNFRAKLTPPPASAFFNLSDATLPDLLEGDSAPNWAGVILVNATRSPLAGLVVRSQVEGGKAADTEIPALEPLSTYKAVIRIVPSATTEGSTADLKLTLIHSDRMLDFQKAQLRVRGPRQTRKVTFLSQIDGSVQYYALNPATDDAPGKALILSTHGASVEAIGQADAYSPKPWANLVAPTNRRPYGFDWEDWGRKDALEVLEHASQKLQADRSRTYVTGHSMGGHGAWYLGLTFPDLFSAMAPSAGWVSFFSYAGGQRIEPSTGIADLFSRAANPSDTLGLVRNSSKQNVYILHGDKDDNVPVREARSMKSALEAIGRTFRYHEQPGAGHWWDGDAAPGADCVDWPPLMEWLQAAKSEPLSGARQVEFVTFNPSVSNTMSWIRIDLQRAPLAQSSVSFRKTISGLSGVTSNVQRLSFAPEAIDSAKNPFPIEIDGQIVPVPTAGRAGAWITLKWAEGRWVFDGSRFPTESFPKHVRPFKEVFENRMIFVYGTRGTPDETAWARAKARFDAQQFWYRGNGAPIVVADVDFKPEVHEPGPVGRDHPGLRNLILYGNADTHALWGWLLGESPLEVRRGRVRVGDRQFVGDQLACLFLQPRKGASRAMVGVVSGSGMTGFRLADRLPYFVSGVAYPDWCVFEPAVLRTGLEGVLAAGYFGTDWKLDPAQTAWREGVAASKE